MEYNGIEVDIYNHSCASPRETQCQTAAWRTSQGAPSHIPIYQTPFQHSIEINLCSNTKKSIIAETKGAALGSQSTGATNGLKVGNACRGGGCFSRQLNSISIEIDSRDEQSKSATPKTSVSQQRGLSRPEHTLSRMLNLALRGWGLRDCLIAEADNAVAAKRMIENFMVEESVEKRRASDRVVEDACQVEMEVLARLNRSACLTQLPVDDRPYISILDYICVILRGRNTLQ